MSSIELIFLINIFNFFNFCFLYSKKSPGSQPAGEDKFLKLMVLLMTGTGVIILPNRGNGTGEKAVCYLRLHPAPGVFPVFCSPIRPFAFIIFIRSLTGIPTTAGWQGSVPGNQMGCPRKYPAPPAGIPRRPQIPVSSKCRENPGCLLPPGP